MNISDKKEVSAPHITKFAVKLFCHQTSRNEIHALECVCVYVWVSVGARVFAHFFAMIFIPCQLASILDISSLSWYGLIALQKSGLLDAPFRCHLKFSIEWCGLSLSLPLTCPNSLCMSKWTVSKRTHLKNKTETKRNSNWNFKRK